MLASMRLCSNAPAQYAIEKALSEHSIQELTNPAVVSMNKWILPGAGLMRFLGLSCVRPAGAFYLFPKVDAGRFGLPMTNSLSKTLTVEKSFGAGDRV